MLRLFTGLLAMSCLVPALLADEPVAVEVSHVESPSITEPFTGKITGNKVRMRAQPSLEGHVVKETSLGEMFVVTGEKEGFYAVVPPQDIRGYVFRTFVLDGHIEGERVNVRLYPDSDAPVIGQLHRGDTIAAQPSESASKWLEIDLPTSTHFYISKEYIEKVGPASFLAQVQTRQREGMQHFHVALLHAQSEMQKPLPQIDLEGAVARLVALAGQYKDFPDIATQAEEASRLIQDLYLQKKMAFLEQREITVPEATMQRLAQIGLDLTKPVATLPQSDNEKAISDKMLVWEPLERAMHQMWVAAHGECSIADYYAHELDQAITLSGMIESYNRPVKNLPGDYILRVDNRPAAFLYSTKINLHELIGKQVTLMAAPRPNNHFAFPAYFVLAVE